MGRGRAKAKQTRVARKLKYSGPDTDLQRLQAELQGHPDSEDAVPEVETPDEEYDDKLYSKYSDEFSDER
jgi:Protein of unknown function (DUF3073)